MTTLRPAPLMLADRHGRVATDLRVSLTDRCNLRCTYCMPAAGLPWLPRTDLLSDAEVNRLIRIAVELLGVRKVRLTGGEPLLRPGLEAIIAAASALDPQPELSLTTNGIGLHRRARALLDSGLTRINVSLDTLQPDRFRQLARRERLSDVLAGLHAAAQAGLRPVKVNAVLIRGINDDEAPDLLQFCLDNGFDLRFIEQMPLDADHVWRREDMVTADEILAALGTEFSLSPVAESRGSAPAEGWLVDGGPATVGVIGSVTRPFCSACARTRLTADGQIRNCLFSTGETDLRSLLRGGADDLAVARAVAAGDVGQGRRARHRHARVHLSQQVHERYRRLKLAILTVRYFAASRAAAGISVETVQAHCLDDALATLRSRHDAHYALVLKASSLLLDGAQVHDGQAALSADASLDVLPPFAGG